MTEGGDDGMSPAKAAERWGVDRTTAYRWINSGRVEAERSKWSGRWRIPLAEVVRVAQQLEAERA